MRTAAIALLALGLGCGIGLYVGTIRAYSFFAQVIEERVARDVNAELLRAGVRRYEVAVDNGTVMILPRER